MDALPITNFNRRIAYRLISSKYPPISLFDDVASKGEFEAIFALQELTNPRLQNQMGRIQLVSREQRPIGIRGFNYAPGPFVHVDPAGTRFSPGSFGVYYAAHHVETAIKETHYHQERYLKNVVGFKYDSIHMRCLKTTFSGQLTNIHNPRITQHDWYNPEDYTAAQALGVELRKGGVDGIYYSSVRDSDKPCVALFTPKIIHDVIQTAHYEYIWDGERISKVVKMTNVKKLNFEVN